MLCSQAEDVGDMRTRLGIDHSYQVYSKSDQRFDRRRPDKIFLFLAPTAMLFSQPERVGNMHN